jgi:cytochrome c-type biogenesis protein CcmE
MSDVSVDRPRRHERLAAAVALVAFAAATILVVLVATKNIAGLCV